MRITIKNGEKYYYVNSPSPAWVRKHDNGALISYGLVVGDNGFTEKDFKRTPPSWLTEISYDDYKHSSCQSRCQRRGDAVCQW